MNYINCTFTNRSVSVKYPYVALLFVMSMKTIATCDVGECFRRSKWRCLDWINEPSTSCWWTLSPSTTAATSSTTRAGWSPERPTQRCQRACTSTPTLRRPVNSGWANQSLSTNSSWPTTSPTNTDSWVIEHYTDSKTSRMVLLSELHGIQTVWRFYATRIITGIFNLVCL